VIATDRSPAALTVARRNAVTLSAPVRLVLTDLISSLAGPVDLVVANLPYVPAEAMGALPLEVQRDPPMALDGGPDGLTLVRRLLADLPRVMAPEAVTLLELGDGQADAVAREATAHGLEVTARIEDLGHCERILELRRVPRGQEGSPVMR